MSKYWQNCFEILEQARNETAKQTTKSVTPAFGQAQAQIQKEINAWYARFANNNEISLQEAKKLLTTRELKEFRWDVQEYIKYGRENAIDPKWMKELENASARFHISRLEALKIRTQNAAERAFGNELDTVDELAAKIYMSDYYHTAYEIQRGLGIGWDVAKIDQRRLDNIISKPWTTDKQTFSDRIWKSKTQLIDSLHTELTQMCILGKAPDQVINNIAKRFDVSAHQAGRLIMTESAYFGSVAQKDCFNELDVEKYEIVATLDHRTSEICQEMDGKVFDMKDFQAGITAPPFHVFCRSCTAPWFEDNDDGTRAARGEDGQTYQVPASMKYEDWKKTFVDGGSKDGLKPVADVEELKKLLSGKEHELRDLKSKFLDVQFEKGEFETWRDNPFYKKFHSMSEDDFQKYVDDLKEQESKLTKELDKISADIDKYYDRPARKTPERDAWDKWKADNNIDVNKLYVDFEDIRRKRSDIRDKINDTFGFSKNKVKFDGKSEQYFVDELDKLTDAQKKVQDEIDDLKKQIEDTLKLQAEAAYKAKDLEEIKKEILQKHETILKTDIQKQELSDLIDGMDKERANLYNQMSANFQSNVYYQNRAGWYSPARKRVEMDMGSYPWDVDMERDLHGAWKTKLHEEMHQLDHVLANQKTDFALLDDGSGYHYKFAFTHPDTVTGKKLIAAIEDDVLHFINKAVDWDVATNGAKVKNIKTLGRISSDAKDATIRYLKTNYPTRKDRAKIDTLTDVIGLSTNGNLHPYKHGFWGHDAAYTKDAGKRGATSEAWANLGAFFIRNDTEVLDALTEVMPETVSAYKEVFDEVIEYAKTNALTYKTP